MVSYMTFINGFHANSRYEIPRNPMRGHLYGDFWGSHASIVVFEVVSLLHHAFLGYECCYLWCCPAQSSAIPVVPSHPMIILIYIYIHITYNIHIYIYNIIQSYNAYLLAWAWGVMAPSEASTETPQKVSKRHVAAARCIQRWKNCRFFWS